MTKQQRHVRKTTVIIGRKLSGYRFHPGDYVLYKNKKYIIRAYGDKTKRYFLMDYKTNELVENVAEYILRSFT